MQVRFYGGQLQLWYFFQCLLSDSTNLCVQRARDARIMHVHPEVPGAQGAWRADIQVQPTLWRGI